MLAAILCTRIFAPEPVVTKVGGDDRIEVWEKPLYPKKKRVKHADAQILETLPELAHFAAKIDPIVLPNIPTLGLAGWGDLTLEILARIEKKRADDEDEDEVMMLLLG